MKTSTDFVNFLFQRLPASNLLPGTYYYTNAVVGSVPAVYLMGTTGQRASQWRLDYAYEKYYSSRPRSEFNAITADWITNGVRMYDCNGLLDAFVGQDNSAAGNFVNWCGIKGDEAYEYIMTNGEYAAGACVFKRNNSGKITHVGFVAGVDGSGVPLIIEAKGLDYGIVMSTINDGWNEYGIPNNILQFANIEQTVFTVTTPVHTGEKYELMQRALRANGYNPGEIDGRWGAKSQAAFDEMLNVNRKPIAIKLDINGETVVNKEY